MLVSGRFLVANVVSSVVERLFNLSVWQRERMVGRRSISLLVVKRKRTGAGGSSSSFRKALLAGMFSRSMFLMIKR